MTDIILTTADDPDLFDLRVGETCLVKGKLEAVRYGGAGGSRIAANIVRSDRVRHSLTTDRWSPSVVISHADWSMTAMVLHAAAARSIRIPLSTYVTVRCQVINEDAELAAIAIWETSNPVPIIVGEMQEFAP